MEENKPSYYAIIPANVRYDNNLSLRSKLLYGEITSLTRKEGYCYATNEYFSELYNISPQQIKRDIDKLINQKYLTKELSLKRYEDGTVKTVRKLYITDLSNRNNTDLSNCDVTDLSNMIPRNNNINNKNIYSKKFIKPTIEDVENYCKEKNLNLNAEHFIDYYESKGWVVGKSPMKDWKAAIRNWCRSNYTKQETSKEVFEWVSKDGTTYLERVKK